jgi:hypothetical protein
MMNVGSRAPACPPFIVALRERGPTAIHDRHPPIRTRIRSVSRSGDPEITFLTIYRGGILILLKQLGVIFNSCTN